MNISIGGGSAPDRPSWVKMFIMLVSQRQGTRESVEESYADRRTDIARHATGVGRVPRHVDYTDEEHGTWRSVQAMLAPLWDQYATGELCAARRILDLPTTRVPQLVAVSERLHTLTGFRLASVPGTVSASDFFGALARRVFPSTQYIRRADDPLYTDQPDVLHELGGHAVALTDPRLADLHHRAGAAAVAAPSCISTIASVFWYSVEFGVVAGADGWKAYGAGLLSSPGELARFSDHAEVRPLDIEAMATTPYDITTYQPVLFGAESMDHVLEVVGGFFSDITHSSSRK